ncbi:CYTH domain-containing protein [Rhodoblastus acidophilus]|jgi:adenylate cyclase|uniref:CYTH domain-containing protein n=1 Tax=Rhodoblastus acidophilus TaxID=1074 RepID=A0A6N8DLR7_RHOAC|nr:CYTH domain-containing protein [Rhodoblastus acidophilus]MCW2272803.1 CYTH domain-containing protein [Rhodoblastus acidophilus]MTV29714.1 CYTH domain-containing protein [Rhodoblastus acidophilus]
MNVEIERKFLLRTNDWRAEVVDVERYRDGLIAETGCGKVRVRLADSFASLTVKSPATGLARHEFEYPISRSDAELMLTTMCGDMVAQKLRHRVIHEGFEWTVDVYEKRLAGIALAEIELDHEDQHIPLPPWVGAEVTGDARFHKRNMMRLSLASAAPLTVEDLLGLAFLAHA